jgi:hypothetical protein
MTLPMSNPKPNHHFHFQFVWILSVTSVAMTDGGYDRFAVSMC